MSFLVSTWAGRIVLVIGGVIIVGGAFAGTICGLVITGDPGDCEPGGGPIVISAANADSFQQKWDLLDLALDSGSPGRITLNESEISSRTNTWIEQEIAEEGGDIDFEDVRVCIHDGYGEATGTLDLPGFLDTKVKIKGSVKLTGTHPVADIDDIDIGNVPDPLLGPLEELAEQAVDEALDRLDLDHTYTVTLTEGEATVEGQP